MRTIGKTVRIAVCGTALMLMALPGISAAAEHAGTGGMSGMKMEGNGGMKMGDHGTMNMGGQDMMKMGTRVYRGKMGPWRSEVRMIDMKARMEGSGMKAQGTMMNSHHIAIALTDPNTKAGITEGTGAVTVIGPDKSTTTYVMTGMQGHFGVDVNLPKPGKYTCNVNLESGGKKGSATFSYTLK